MLRHAARAARVKGLCQGKSCHVISGRQLIVAWGPQALRERKRLKLTGDARPRFFELCSRSGGDAREAMTVGCKPTRLKGKRRKEPRSPVRQIGARTSALRNLIAR